MTKTARAVIGANFGDEGKGLVTDYLAAQGAGIVVRYNGGAQAGHTVVTPDGMRHVFAHFGAGTLAGVPTFLSQFFVCNPIMFFPELEKLINLRVEPVIYAHPACKVTTFADMIINQRKEDARGDKRHGSVGLGFAETLNRSQIPELAITMGDLWNGIKLEDKLAQICAKYTQFRTGYSISKPEAMIHSFMTRCEKMAEVVRPLGIQQCPDPIFEGAQGLLLDQNNKEFYPHLTRSNTGMQNIRTLCAQGGFDNIEPYYVSRTYLTRHGAGPLPGENKKLKYRDDTNLDHAYQGSIRFAPLDFRKLTDRVLEDSGDMAKNVKMVFTHCDQLDVVSGFDGDLRSYGETRNDIEAMKG